MKQSLRAKRMAKHHRRAKQTTKVNLVSLMDIFTILVFFLLVNSSDVEVLQTDKSIKLPASVADQIPDTNLIVMVNKNDVVIAGRRVTSVADLLANKEDKFPALIAELTYQASKARPLNEEEKLLGRAVTIMGDHEISYALLKKIMANCAAADYRNISLAVTQKVVDETEVVGS
jgi:biopolymer transport protein ExbD